MSEMRTRTLVPAPFFSFPAAPFFPLFPPTCVLAGGGIEPLSGVRPLAPTPAPWIPGNGDAGPGPGAGEKEEGEETVTIVGVNGLERRREGGGAANGYR